MWGRASIGPMGSVHSHRSGCDHHLHSHHLDSEKNILSALLINLIFTLIEIVGGFLSGSVAVLADAIHDLGDTLSLAIAYGLQKYSKRRRDSDFSYGYSRFSLLSALFSGFAMLVASAFVLEKIWERIHNPQNPKVMVMFGVAIIGVMANSWAALKLSKGKTQNEKMLRWHLLEDAFGWVSILLGSILIYFKNWTWVDPALGAALSIYVVWNILKNLRDTLRLFLQAKPDDFNESDFLAKVRQIAGVEDVHDLHVW